MHPDNCIKPPGLSGWVVIHNNYQHAAALQFDWDDAAKHFKFGLFEQLLLEQRFVDCESANALRRSAPSTGVSTARIDCLHCVVSGLLAARALLLGEPGQPRFRSQ